MKGKQKKVLKGERLICLAGIAVFAMAACGKRADSGSNVIIEQKAEAKVVNLFGPMEKSNPNADNIARSAFDLTVGIAEEKFDLSVEYRTYTAENYQEKTYDEVTLDRAHSNMDDWYLLNPDTIQILGKEGKLVDLSQLENAKNLREVVRTANTVDGKLVAIPQEVVAHGLFVNKDMFDQYHLELPETPEDFLECCRVFQENGIETPVGANRWWLENFVFAQAYADLYNGENTEAEIEALNKGEKKYSDYMRPGFEYLKKMLDLGYIDGKTAYTYEAIDGEGPDFLAQKTPIVMAYWGAANAETAYGKTDFELQVIGFPSSRGQMPVVSMTGYGILAEAKNFDNAMAVMNEIMSDEALQLYTEKNKVISPSKNVEVDCVPALKPLNDKIKENIYVLGSNAGMDVEQWGNTCLIVRELLNGATVDECMAQFDRLQENALKERSAKE
ncbi:MAG: extracellular solute-binding protein [Lachnospiraceae bacterium]|nr:extracellular solute-binding protein [Lachnospiraceae bacterium]